MSKSEKGTQGTGQQSGKASTKYDMKVQRRKEQKDKEQRDKQFSTVGGIILVVALACLVASFPIRTWLTVNGTYIEVGGEKIPKVEFDYNYNMASSRFIMENYYTLYYYFGVDLTGDLTTQMYSDTLTWKDYFDQLAVENIARNKALAKEAQAEGFTHDTTEEYKEYMENLKESATEAGYSVRDYIKSIYGVYATESRVKPFVEEAMYVSAYSTELTQRMTPSQDEIQAYYEENKASYDSVDYYMVKIDAELPTEPTELADPVEDSTQSGEAQEESVYQPSEAEIAAAMEKASIKAETARKEIKTQGELVTNAKRSDVTVYLLSQWLFDEERKAGDSTVIEVAANNCYYALGFEGRYLSPMHTVDIHAVVTEEDNGQAILDEWKSGAATEESFAEICDKYNTSDIISAEGGLLSGVQPSKLSEELRDWLTDTARTAGDTVVITPEDDTYTYVMYYVAQGEEEWISDIRSTLLSQKVNEYVDELAANMEIKDSKGRLTYLKVSQESEDDAQASPDAQENGDGETQE